MPLLIYGCIHSLYAQMPSDSTPAKCSWNLKNPIFTAIEHIEHVPYAKDSANDCKDVGYEDDSENNGVGCTPENECVSCDPALFYDVYYPQHKYNNAPLPAVILGHPGGFAECSTYDQDLMRTLCEEFAKRGFVAFNVEYRRGRVKDIDPTLTSVQQQLAAYRGFQDIRGVIRSIIKRQRLQLDTIKIDTNYIFIGGASAGGFSALNAAWYTNAMVYNVYSTPSGQNIQNALGPLDADYYYGEPTIQYKAKIKGVMVMWSGMAIPYLYRTGTHKESDFFTNATLKPLIAFHGEDDPVFPYYLDDLRQIVNFSPDDPLNNIYHSESICLLNGPYTLEGTPSTPDLINASPLNMYNILEDIDNTILKELYLDCNMKHGLDKDGPNLDSDFGLGPTATSVIVKLYMVQRAATFFQAIMNGGTPQNIGQPTKFTECVNNRIRCNVQANTEGCQNNDACPGH